jgi:ankyrin repeat protein
LIPFQVFLEGGADVTARNKNGLTTTLHLASPEGKVDVMRALEAGADPAAQDSSGMTPLHSASSEGEIEVVTALLEARADVAAKNKT